MSETTVERGFALPCPRCQEAQAVISLNLGDMATCRCEACEEEFTLADVRVIIEKWGPVLKWIDQAPVIAE